jgi:hypothetical protein
MHLELQRPTIEAKPDRHGRNGVKANKMKKRLLHSKSNIQNSKFNIPLSLSFALIGVHSRFNHLPPPQ